MEKAGLDEGISASRVNLVEDQISVTKRARVTDRVRVETVTDTFEELVRSDLSGEALHIERVPLGSVIEPGSPVPRIRTDGDVTIIPILEEIVVVEKRLVLKEELRVTRSRTQEIVETPVTLRKQRAIVGHIDEHGVPFTDQLEQDK